MVELDWRLILDRLADPVVAADGTGHIVYVNQATERLLGWSVDELAGQPLTVIQPRRLREAHVAGFRRYCETREPKLIGHPVRVPTLHRDGSEIDVELTLSTVRAGPKEGDDLFIGALRVVADTNELDRDRATSRDADLADWRAAFLAKASAVLATSLDEPTILRQLADLAVPLLADWCVFDMIDDDGSSRRAVVAQADPKWAAVARELEERYPIDLDAPNNVVAKVLRTRQPSLMTEVPDELLVAAARDARHLELLRSLGVTSHLVVPLVARGRTLGAVTLGFTESGRRYDPDDLVLAEDLTRRAALAVDNARLYDEQVRARTRVHELAAERALVLGQIVDGVIIADADGRIIFVNEAARRLHGRVELGVSVEDYTESYGLLTMEGTPYPSRELPLARAILHGETTHNAEWRVRRPDGSEVVARGSAAPVLAEDGSQVGAVLTLHDVTAEREFERHKDEFIVTASHNLKTPLTTIKGWAQLLRQRAERDPTREKDLPALAAIDRQAQAMHRLIERMLEASRLQLGQQPDLRIHRFDFHELVSREVALHQNLADGHTFNLVVNGGRDVAWRGDPERLAQGIDNLLTNAVRYSPAGSSVDVAVDSNGDEIRLTVRARGLGIPTEALPHVFEQADRAGNVTRDAARQPRSALDLGLFNAQRIAALHGGRIDVESAEGRVSTVTLVLPLNT